MAKRHLIPPLRLDDQTYEVAVREHPHARRVRLKVLPPGRVEVVVPRGFGRRRLPALIREHHQWIVRILRQMGREWVTHAELPTQMELAAIDEIWHLQPVDATHAVAREAIGHQLSVSGTDAGGRREAVRRWLLRKGRRHLEPWLAAVATECGLDYRGLTIRTQRSRWGSCSAQRRINLNAALLFLPAHLVRYVLVHELCHTRHLNHSPAYWDLVAQHEPGFQAAERELREAITHVPLWLRYP